jgi:predicted nucleic acid-binding protein
VSAIQLYEIYKVIRRDLSEERAIEALAALRRATLVDLDATLAIEAADIALDTGLAMADSIIYATAKRYDATLVSSDSDIADLPNTVVIR